MGSHLNKKKLERAPKVPTRGGRSGDAMEILSRKTFFGLKSMARTMISLCYLTWGSPGTTQSSPSPTYPIIGSTDIQEPTDHQKWILGITFPPSMIYGHLGVYIWSFSFGILKG